MHCNSLLRASAAALLALAGAASAHATSYRLVDLGLNKVANQVNDQRHVVGDRLPENSGSALRALEYQDGRWHHLAPNNSKWAAALGIDSAGDIAGESDPDESFYEFMPTYWPHDGAPVLFALPNNSQGALGYGSVSGIADGPRIVGTWYDPVAGFSRCYIWTPDTGSVDIGLPPNGHSCHGAAINRAGEVVGQATMTPAYIYGDAFLYDGSAFHDLGVLPGDANSQASALNEAGHVVGWSTDGSRDRAFLWNGSAMQDLTAGTIYSGGASAAQAINDDDVIVGYGTSSVDHLQHALVFAGGQVTALETEISGPLGDWSLQSAASISSNGTIVGSGRRQDGVHAFMLVPVVAR